MCACVCACVCACTCVRDWIVFNKSDLVVHTLLNTITVIVLVPFVPTVGLNFVDCDLLYSKAFRIDTYSQ